MKVRLNVGGDKRQPEIRLRSQAILMSVGGSNILIGIWNELRQCYNFFNHIP